MSHYPRYKYKKSDSKPGFEGIVMHSAAHEEQMREAHQCEFFDSPADFGIETHPNPHEVKPKKAAPEAKKKDKA